MMTLVVKYKKRGDDMGKIEERYNQYMPYADYDGDSESELLELIVNQTKKLEKKGVDLKLTASTRLLDIYTNEIYSGIITPYHKHDYFELNYVYEGRLMEYVDSRKLVLEAGDLILMSTEIYHTSHPIGKAKAVNVIISKSFAAEVEKILSSYDKENYLTYVIKNGDYIVFRNLKNTGIEQVISEITAINLNRKKYEPYIEPTLDNLAKGMFLALTRAQITEHSYRKNTEGINTTPTRERFSQYVASRDDRIMWYISDNLGTVTLEALSKQFGYSVQQIRRIVKKRTGMTFATYIQTVRLSRVCELLRSSDLPVKKIAQTMGIESPEYFSRWFKKEHHVSPTQYRKRHMQK